MANTTVTSEALIKMAEMLRQSAEEIMASKVEMDSQLRSFVWDDSTGYYFTGKYEEDFKPIQTRLIPRINDFVKYLSQLDIQVSGYAGTAAMVGVGIGAFNGGERHFSNDDTKQAESKSDKMPKLKTEERCQFPHTAKGFYDKWAYTTDKNGNRVLKRYPIGPDGKELTAENYREFDKRTLMRSLSDGMDFVYDEEDLGELKVKDGKVYGHKGIWIGDNKMIVNERLFTDKNISHENVIETVFHENQHIIQGKQLSMNCLTDVPEDGGYLSPTCKDELKEKGYYKAGESCQKEYDAYINHWTEVQAREEGEKGRIEAEMTVDDALIKKKLMKPRILYRKPN